MLVVLWIVNVLLALGFLGAGGMKLITPKEKLVTSGMAWAENFAPASIKLIAAAEIIGAAGLIAPLATGIAPLLTPLAAVGLFMISIGAVVTHARRKESFAPSAVLGVLALVSVVVGAVVLL